MKELDDIEALARSMMEVCVQCGQDNCLARAVLAMAPVVRAAEAQVRSEQRASSPLVELEKSVRQMRAALGGE